jgi:hypothetical protein
MTAAARREGVLPEFVDVLGAVESVRILQRCGDRKRAKSAKIDDSQQSHGKKCTCILAMLLKATNATYETMTESTMQKRALAG